MIVLLGDLVNFKLANPLIAVEVVSAMFQYKDDYFLFLICLVVEKCQKNMNYKNVDYLQEIKKELRQ